MKMRKVSACLGVVLAALNIAPCFALDAPDDNKKPAIVLAGLSYAKKSTPTPDVKIALERLFDPKQATNQFRDPYRHSDASPDTLWEVRLASGAALGKDMKPEMRLKAREILLQMKAESLHPSSAEKAEWLSYASRTEIAICNGFDKLAALGNPIRDVVEAESKTAKDDYLSVLQMALARLGDNSRVPDVARQMVDSPNHTIRFCAADTLRALAPRSAIPALYKALRDPYHRQDGACVRIGDGEIYPVRVAAAGALSRLGEDFKTVRALMQQP